MQSPTPKQWRTLLAPFSKACNKTAWFQLITTFTAYLAAISASVYVALAVSFWYALPLIVITSGLLVRLFVLQHDCGHGSLFVGAKRNKWAGRFLAIFTLTPLRYWSVSHNRHHATSGHLEKVVESFYIATVAEYKAMGRWQRFKYWIYRQPWAFIPAAVLMHMTGRLVPVFPGLRKDEFNSVLINGALVMTLVATLTVLLGWMFLLVLFTTVFLANALGVWLFYVQHQYEGAKWAREGGWNFHDSAIDNSSFFDMPRILHWFTGNIGYHHVHHLDMKVPNYNLKAAHEAVPELSERAIRLTLADTLRCARVALWDEEQGRVISFAEFRRRYNA